MALDATHELDRIANAAYAEAVAWRRGWTTRDVRSTESGRILSAVMDDLVGNGWGYEDAYAATERAYARGWALAQD